MILIIFWLGLGKMVTGGIRLGPDVLVWLGRGAEPEGPRGVVDWLLMVSCLVGEATRLELPFVFFFPLKWEELLPESESESASSY